MDLLLEIAVQIRLELLCSLSSLPAEPSLQLKNGGWFLVEFFIFVHLPDIFDLEKMVYALDVLWDNGWKYYTNNEMIFSFSFLPFLFLHSSVIRFLNSFKNLSISRTFFWKTKKSNSHSFSISFSSSPSTSCFGAVVPLLHLMQAKLYELRTCLLYHLLLICLS